MNRLNLTKMRGRNASSGFELSKASMSSVDEEENFFDLATKEKDNIEKIMKTKVF